MKIAGSGCLFRLMVLILALIAICVMAEAQKIEVQNYRIDRTDKGFVINGTVTASDLNPPGQVVEFDGLSIAAYIKQNSGSQYPKLPDSRYVVYPPGSVTAYTPGSGAGGTMTKEEYEGIGIDKINAVGLLLRPTPVWSSYGGIGDWMKKAPSTVTMNFEGIVPLEHEGKEVRIVATLEHRWGGPYSNWPAFSYAHAILHEGILKAETMKILKWCENSCIIEFDDNTDTARVNGFSPGSSYAWKVEGGKILSGQNTNFIRIAWSHQDRLAIYMSVIDAAKACRCSSQHSVQPLAQLKNIIVTVKRVKGDFAEIQRGGSGELEPLEEGTSIGLNDHIITGLESEVELEYSNRGKITVKEMTNFDVGYFAVPDDGLVCKTDIKVGELDVKVDPKLKNVDFSVSSPTSAISVRGTHFLISHNEELNKTTVTVIEGIVDVKSCLLDLPEKNITAGQRISVDKSGFSPIEYLSPEEINTITKPYEESTRVKATTSTGELVYNSTQMNLKDARVYEYSYLNWNNANWGAWDYLALKSKVNGISNTNGRIYIWFDPSLLGNLSQDKGVFLQLMHWPTEQDGNITADIFRVTERWEEGNGTYHSGDNEPDAAGTISWSRQPAWDKGMIWSSRELYPNAEPYNVSWNITGLVRAWTSGKFANYGLVIVGSDEGVAGYSHIFGSSENTDNILRPTISIRKASESSGTADETVNDSQGSLSKDLSRNQSQEYLFLEVWTDENGTVLDGTPIRMMIDFPTYFIRDSVLETMSPIKTGAETEAVIGIGSSLSGDLGGGAASSLYPIDQLPYEADGVKVTEIRGDVAIFDYQGKQITLGPGERLQNSVEEFRIVEGTKYKVEITTLITNHGRVELQRGNEPTMRI